MSERITEIREYSGQHEYCVEGGFQIVTTEQTITLAIDDEASCCEQWGYFLTEDDPSKFVGAELRGVRLTDVNRSHRKFETDWNAEEDENTVHLDDGEVMFADIETDRGILQFVAYNAHNGYYGHTARISARQLQHEVVL